ncbi:MAG: EF-P beta-lysylation protein EpmB [Gammaproteobacteria bacterium]|nr:EF-P beta-lysylation protein EpmB [Gammaproteobacteria bacterium]MCW8924173.1 EF-P beta-lysylation protein EpmB [Gammaproteobacteria bacterium]
MPVLPVSTIYPPLIKNDWKRQLAEAISSPAELLQQLELEHLLDEHIDIDPAFPLRVPQAYVQKISKADPNDPLLLQILPSLAENAQTGEVDPVGDLNAMPSSGLLHKYHGRALIISTAACAIHCRYCFRRHFPYSDARALSSQWPTTLEYLKQHPDIREVILSGGDPLVLEDSKLAALCRDLETIPHIKWLRIHTRLPVVLPARITPRLLEWMQHTRFRITMVIHANHANELDTDEMIALQTLQDANITLLNQSVLLKNVNDNASTLIDLSHRLHDCAVTPYYLHMLDRVKGGLHFEVNREKACNIIDNMRSKLPGYLIPRLVIEEKGKDSKTAISNI